MTAPANDRWHPLNAVCDELIRLQMERMGWLLRAGPIAAKLNRQSQGDA